MNMETSFAVYEQTLRQLAQLLGRTYTNEDWQALIDQAIEGTNVSRSMKVADWVVDFFSCFVQQREADDISFDDSERGIMQDDRWISLASVLLPGEWEDEGEYRSVTFESIRAEGYIMYEGNFYRVNQY